MGTLMYDIKTIGESFQVTGSFTDASPYGSGHINDTFAATYRSDGRPLRYIFQRINHSIFKNVPELMDNIERVTSFARDELVASGSDDLERRVLTLIPTSDGQSYHMDKDGNYWRVYIFIERAKTYDVIEATNQAFEAAKAFGDFQKLLAAFPAPRLHETIPGFHHTRQRFDTLQAAIDADVCNRAATVRDEISYAQSQESIVDVLLDLQASGDIPERITHNDTKLNNVMIDDATGKGICVIDLDTVMPGQILYDFGDMVRTASRPTPEDETDLSKVVMQMDMFEAIARGYLESAHDFLVPGERANLAFSAKLITFEIGIRFLTDYLQGDVYFKTHREGQNIDRCRKQFKMVESMERQMGAMQKIIKETK
jgi:hypothetical protein